MFKRILFVSEGRDGDLEAMKQALVLAGANASSLDILVVHSGVPDASSTYLPAFEAFLAQQAETCLQQAQATGAPAPSGPVSVRVEGGHAPDVRIVQEVLRNGHDLVIKAAASGTDGRGFQALDMGLLRKCPVPLWLHRPRGGTESGSFQVAVAIDPRESKEGLLARHLLQLADGIADLLGARLSVLSCWDYALEGYLRNHVFASGSDDGQLQQAVTEERCRHRAELAKLIRLADLNTRPSIHHPRGRPINSFPTMLPPRALISWSWAPSPAPASPDSS
ncbi:universal stress protein [Marinobacterium aestuariivivens]|uniref:Universal stress protein n=1 Tax=Marinobacterium aestuariivivens TaxID=1698799 RepID=A0ABW1ZZG8_9GAMM